MLIKMIVKDAHRQWEEEYKTPADVSNMSEEQQAEEATAIAEEVIQNFNDNPRPFEIPRTLVDAIIMDLTTQPDCHRWVKTSDVVQVADHIGMHETHVCNLCGHTGKQYQMDGPIIVDGSESLYPDDDEDEEISESQLRDRAEIARLREDNKLLTDFVDSVNQDLGG
jgi:hypothetical protein